uniref:Uncharacterized protein n=1 Tax=Arundo donax TaxID=35708 RepID=A0A0A9AEK0_ARUDO
MKLNICNFMQWIQSYIQLTCSADYRIWLRTIVKYFDLTCKG